MEFFKRIDPEPTVVNGCFKAPLCPDVPTTGVRYRAAEPHAHAPPPSDDAS
jgi:hypothetical protein